MKIFPLLMVFFINTVAVAFNVDEDMTAVSCEYDTDKKSVKTSVKVDCGEFVMCDAQAVCNFVENTAFKEEFNGDRVKASEAAKSWSDKTLVTRALTLVAKSAYSEFTRKPPKFLTADVKMYCLSKGTSCPSALACALDRGAYGRTLFNTSQTTSQSLDEQRVDK